MRLIIAVFGFCLLAQGVAAQNITLQQPVIGTFSVNTVVSVSDRGEAYLGGVGSRFAGRNSFGFGPFTPPGVGYGINSSSASARVWIHDPELADQQLLGAVESRIVGASPEQREDLAKSILRARGRQMDFDYSRERYNQLSNSGRFAPALSSR